MNPKGGQKFSLALVLIAIPWSKLAWKPRQNSLQIVSSAQKIDLKSPLHK